MLDDVTLALLGDRAARRENPALTEANSPAQAAVKTLGR